MSGPELSDPGERLRAMEQRMGRPSKVSDEQVRVAVGEARNMRQLLALLGLAEHGGNYESIRARLRRLGIEEPRFFPSRAEAPEVTDEEMARIVAAADSYAEVARLLGLGNSTAAQRRAKRMVVKSGHDISHFLGQSWNRGLGLGGREPEPLERLLVQGRLVPTDRLRKRLIEAGLLPAFCDCCKREEWQGGPIPLELDHINGDRMDNRLENLRLLCPNCHALTDTYRGRNVGRRPEKSNDEPLPEMEPLASTATDRLFAILGGSPAA